jgi:Domain of unknown function (DUF1906)
MLAGKLPCLARSWRPLAVAAAVVALAAPVTAASASTAGSGSTPARTPAVAHAALKRVSYRGYSFKVPSSWHVVDLRKGGRTCVRFDRHVLYLGNPGTNESCPSLLVGTTESVLIQPASAKAHLSAVENEVARQVTVTIPRIKITATFDFDPDEIYQILASASLPQPAIRMPDPAAAGQATAGPATQALQAARAKKATPVLPAGVSNFHGLGFDACTAPSEAYMKAWRAHSPYRAIGVYIGGSDKACAQPNLTAAWLRREAAAGWHFIPLYVGPQAEFGELSAPASQGLAAANDAVTQAERLGFGPQTPIYYDMEAFSPAKTGATLRFLSAWTTRLHTLGYSSGVYSSSSSGIAVLAQQYNSQKYAMPDVIYDALWNGKKNTNDSVFSAGQWANHQRVHQFAGNVVQTFGGDTINIDKDFMDVDLPLPGGTSQATSAVIQKNGVIDAFYRGSGNKLFYVRHALGSKWAAPRALASSVESTPTVVNRRPGVIDVFYQGAHGDLWQVARKPSGKWSSPHRLKRMGAIGSAPSAVAQSNGVIDIFWKGSADLHLWHGRFSPVSGWSGPKRLGGKLEAGPSPVEAAPGTVEVFWQGTDNSLWYVIRRMSGAWSKPRKLGMGPLGGPPQATAATSGAAEVFWPGSNGQLWYASFTPGKGWHGPRDLGGKLSSVPTPVTSTSGPIRVFFRGQDGHLWQTQGSPKKGWHRAVRQAVGTVGGAPVVAIGYRKTSIGVFWKSGAGKNKLWSASLKGSTWTKPHAVGSNVA